MGLSERRPASSNFLCVAFFFFYPYIPYLEVQQIQACPPQLGKSESYNECTDS